MEKQITVQEAENLQTEYINTRSSVIDAALGYQDVRNFNFSIDELKEFIQIVEDYGNTNNQEDMGISIFMGAYETDPNNEPKATVFLAPTSDNGNLINKNVNPLNFAKPGGNDY